MGTHTHSIIHHHQLAAMERAEMYISRSTFKVWAFKARFQGEQFPKSRLLSDRGENTD